MVQAKRSFRYGKPVSPKNMPTSRKRLREYDDCLREFLESAYSNWEVNLSSLPSKKPRVILSSLKWRTKNNDEFKNIKAIMSKNRIYLEKVKTDEPSRP